jgi:hypothetical protein
LRRGHRILLRLSDATRADHPTRQGDADQRTELPSTYLIARRLRRCHVYTWKVSISTHNNLKHPVTILQTQSFYTAYRTFALLAK